MKIFLSLGSNLGHRMLNLEKAIALLKQQAVLSGLQCSIVLETIAILPHGADVAWNKPFLNMVVCGENTSSSPEDLLIKLKAIEAELGRDPHAQSWAPRIIDIDILLMQDVVRRTTHLSVPHIQISNRPFLVHLIALLDPFCRYPKVKDDNFSGRLFMEIAASIPEIYDCFTASAVLHPRLVGIVNVTPDSFSDGGLYLEPDKAAGKALELSRQGAHVVEFGAQSTRPGARLITSEEEYALLQPVLDKVEVECKVGLDSFSDEVICKILRTNQIEWINDVKGALAPDTLKLIANSGCNLVCMHSISVPPIKGHHIDFNQNPIDVINSWSECAVERLVKFGFKPDAIIIDPGIGFGKFAYQNIFILKHVELLKNFGCKVLVGASRKSYIASFARTHASDRDLETLGISEHLKQHVDYLRVHNVEEHQRYLVSRQVLDENVRCSTL